MQIWANYNRKHRTYKYSLLRLRVQEAALQQPVSAGINANVVIITVSISTLCKAFSTQQALGAAGLG